MSEPSSFQEVLSAIKAFVVRGDGENPKKKKNRQAFKASTVGSLFQEAHPQPLNASHMEAGMNIL